MNSKIKNAEDLLYEGTVYDCSLREEQIVEKMPLGTEVIPLQFAAVMVQILSADGTASEGGYDRESIVVRHHIAAVFSK